MRLVMVTVHISHNKIILPPAPHTFTLPPVPLCVVNTHLFYHPYAPHIRTMHTAAILEEAATFVSSQLEHGAEGRCGEHRLVWGIMVAFMKVSSHHTSHRA